MQIINYKLNYQWMKCFRLEASLVIYYQFDGKLGSFAVESRHFRGKPSTERWGASVTLNWKQSNMKPTAK